MESNFDMTTVLGETTEETQVGSVIEQTAEEFEGSLLGGESEESMDSNSMFGSDTEVSTDEEKTRRKTTH